MKSIIFLLFVCTFFCVAYTAPDPADFQTLDKLESLLQDKIRTDKQSMDTKAIAEGIDQAAIETLIEKARAESGGRGRGSLIRKLIRTALKRYGAGK